MQTSYANELEGTRMKTKADANVRVWLIQAKLILRMTTNKKNSVSNQPDLLVAILICDGASVVGNLFSNKTECHA